MRFVICNAHWNNRGDEAALLSLLNLLKEKYNNPRITVLIKDKVSVEEFPFIYGVNVMKAQFKAAFLEILLSVISRGMVGRNNVLNQSVHEIATSVFILYAPGVRLSLISFSGRSSLSIYYLSCVHFSTIFQWL